MLEYRHWAKHKDLYGPISSLTVLGQKFVIVNDPEIAFELMRDRSSIHSSRPEQAFAKMSGWQNTTAILPYGDSWKIHRKTITKMASSNISVSVFERIQEAEAAHFLVDLLATPNSLFDHIRKEAGSVILKITYGYTTEAHKRDPLVDLANQATQDFADATVPGKWTVDVFPFLRYIPEWMPGAGFKRLARRYAYNLDRCANLPYAFVKSQMNEKRHTPSFLSQCIESTENDPQLDFIHKYAALTLYLGGADTTVSALMTFFLAMMVFPDVQKKAQEEIDRVIGSDRLPLIADRDKLPYIEALLKETHRWHQVLPMCVPHASTEEDECRGYRIPKGAVLIANNWLFMHDPNVYPDPMAFRPERHLDMPGHKAEPNPRNFIFGYGRRICPGRFVADNALFITIAQSLAVFNIEKPYDKESGQVIEPTIEFEPGAISHPLPYKASIKPRSERHKILIKATEKEYPWAESDAKVLESLSC